MLSKVHHVGIVVRSADDALGFYRDALGLPTPHQLPRAIEELQVRNERDPTLMLGAGALDDEAYVDPGGRQVLKHPRCHARRVRHVE